MELHQLKCKIEELRTRMIISGIIHGLNADITIKYSRELDFYLVIYIHLSNSKENWRKDHVDHKMLLL